jgi:hypothetical protein
MSIYGNNSMISMSSFAKLLGYVSIGSMLDHFNDKDRQLCRQLAGPYGKTLHKMLLARQGARQMKVQQCLEKAVQDIKAVSGSKK